MPPQVVQGLVTLYQLDTTMLGGPVFYFTSAETFDRTVTWGGQDYAPLPMDASGFEINTTGQLPQPSVTFSNIYGAGNLLLDSYKGLVGADLTRIVTLERFLDDGASPDPAAYISREVFTVAQKASHNAVGISFKLAAKMDQQGTSLPRRKVLRDVCSRVYRFWDGDSFDYSKADCPYTGDAMFDVHDVPTTISSNDVCSHLMSGCQARFGVGAPLPAYFFPGVGRVK
jgi:lambda family phage minor tail protein L